MSDNRETIISKLSNDRVEYQINDDWITQNYYSECFGDTRTSVQIPVQLANPLRDTLKQCVELNNGKLFQHLCSEVFHSYFDIETAIVTKY